MSLLDDNLLRPTSEWEKLLLPTFGNGYSGQHMVEESDLTQGCLNFLLWLDVCQWEVGISVLNSSLLIWPANKLN